MNYSEGSQVLRLLLFSPLVTLFKLRVNSTISKHTLNRINVDRNLLINIRHKYVKDKISCVIDGSITKSNNSIPIKSLNQKDLMHDFVEYKSPYVNVNCFELDHINGHFVGYISAYDSMLPNKAIAFCYNNALHRFTFNVNGAFFDFNMIVYAKNHKTIVRTDSFTMGLGNQDGATSSANDEKLCTSLHFKAHVNDNIIFIGVNQLRNSRSVFSLIYNANSGDNCFSYIPLDSNISDICSTSLVANVSILNNKRILCVSNQESHWDAHNYYVNNPEINIYVYDINNRTLIKKITIITIIEKKSWIHNRLYTTSLSFMDGYLVHNKNDNIKNLITQTWINSNNWCVEETIVVTNPDIFNIKLIEIHDYLSAIVVINHKKYPSGLCENCSADVYYF